MALGGLKPLAPEKRHDHAAAIGKPIIDARHVAVKFKVEGGSVDAVKDVSFQLYRGETIAIVGESGSGKSVTARTVMGLLTRRATVSTHSNIVYDGKNVLNFSDRQRRALRGNRISMIFQEPMSSLNPVYTVGAQIIEAIRVHQKMNRKQAMERSLDLLRQVHIPDPEARFNQYPHQLSGGQRQRIMIAMALANSPDVLIADEPTTALDVTVQAQILNLIRDLQKKLGMAVILITHDLTVVRQFSDYVYVMQHGEVKEHNTTAALFAHPQHAYTRHLLSSEPKGMANPMPVDSAAILEGRNVRVSFMLKHGGFFRSKLKELVAVDSLSLKLHRHETLGLVGESGSGKTTVARMVVGLLPPSSGEVVIDGVSMTDARQAQARQKLRRRIQMIFQDPYASLNPRFRVDAIVAEPIRAFDLIQGERDIRARVGELLNLVGLHPDDGLKYPHEFSGGQRQRIAIARALASEAEFIVCDEPTSALDVSVQAQILNLMRDLQDKFGLTYLLISHNLAVVRHMATRIGVMYLGRIVEIAEGRELFSRPRMPYTKMLLGAVPDLAMSGRQRIPVKGEIPNPINPPPGCAFNPRCPLAFELCRREAPELIDGVACHAVNTAPAPA